MINMIFEQINSFLGSIIFFDIFFGLVPNISMPFIVFWLILGGLYFTIRFNFINLRMFAHSYYILRGKYKNKYAQGDISSFQSLSTALSGTVGLGNIAGVAIAIIIGGAGAIFWMMLAGFLGMTLKFTEVTLSQIYRKKDFNGKIIGGAMYYLSEGFKEKGYSRIGKMLAVIFAIFTIFAALGAGNLFQVSQATGAISEHIPFINENPLVFSGIIAFLVGSIIIGGVTRIAKTATSIVSLMIIVYLTASIIILINNYAQIPEAISLILSEAFNLTAIEGGLIGALIQGFKRGVFSSEAGIGSAAIIHSTASVKYPVQQGFVALYEPFIDTIVICTITALVIITTGVYDPNGEFATLIQNREGAALTSAAFGTVISWFPYVLMICIVLFTFSTIISWFYYSEKSWIYLFGERFTILYKIIFLGFTIIASIISSSLIIDFSDMLLLGMAIPNLIGLYMLQGVVAKHLKKYLLKLKNNKV